MARLGRSYPSRVTIGRALISPAAPDQTISAHGISSSEQFGYAPQAPLQVSDCHLWLRPETIAGLTNGTGIATWPDESGLGNDGTQATGASQPIKTNNQVSGYPVARFDGTDDRLPITNTDALATLNAVSGTTMFVVAANAAGAGDGGNRQAIFYAAGALGNSRASIAKRGTAPGKVTVGGRRLNTDTLQSIAETTNADTGWAAHGGVLDYTNALASIYRNGTLETGPNAFQTAGTSNATNSVAVAVGASGLPNEFWFGDIAEVIVYSRVLTGTERDLVTNYLLDKYGLAVVSPTQVSVAAVPTGELMGVAQVAQQIQAAGIPSAETIGNVATTTLTTVAATGIPSAQVVGTTTSTLFVSPVGILSAGQIGQAAVAVTQAIAATGVPSQERAGTHIVTPGAVTIAAAGIVSGELFGNIAASANYAISSTGISSGQAVGQAAVGQAIAAIGISSVERHGASVVAIVAGITINAVGIPSQEAVSTQLDRYSDTYVDDYGQFTVSLAVTPKGISSAEAIGNAVTGQVVAPQTITATGVPSAQVVGTALVGQAVTPAGILSSEALGAATATPGAVTISPVGIKSSEAFGAVIVAIAAPQSLSIVGIVSEQRFGTAQVAQALSATGVPSAERAGNSVVTPGVVALSVAGISSQQIFGTPFVSLGLTLTIASIQTAQRFGDSAIIPEGVPEAILASTNLAGFVTAIRDNPSSPDSEFLTAIDPTATTDLRVSFTTPFKQPGAVGGPRTFRVYVRRTANAGANPNAIIELWESGIFRRELATTSVTSTAGQLIEAAMDPADLTDPTGAGVELRLRGAP